MSQPKTVNFNLDEEVISSDLNRIGNLADKAVMDTTQALVGGYLTPIFVQDVVRWGLSASVGAGLQTVIGTGELMHLGGVVTDQSNYKLGVLETNTTLTHAAADPAFPRIDRIYAVVSSVGADNSIRNILQTPSRVVTPTSVPKTMKPVITLFIAPGIPAPSPQPPVTPAGTALWDIPIPAAAVSLNSNYFMDLRIPFNRWVQSFGEHFVERGLGLGCSQTSQTQATLTSGRGWSFGANIDLSTDRTYATTGANNILENQVALGSDQDWHLYLVPFGAGFGIAQGTPDGFVPVLSRVTPATNGSPSVPITVNPLWSTGASITLAITTTLALYVGTIFTDSSDNFEFGACGQLGNRGGTVMESAVNPTTGLFAISSAILKAPKLSWVDNDTIRVGIGSQIINGILGQNKVGNCTFASSLVFGLGEVRTVSTWYYIYVRPNTSSVSGGLVVARKARRSNAVVWSNEAPSEDGSKPTPEPGFQSYEYLFVGTFYNNAANHIVAFTREGNIVNFQTRAAPFIGIANQTFLGSAVPIKTAFTAIMPATSHMARVLIYCQMQNGAASTSSIDRNFFAPGGTASPALLFSQLTGSALGDQDGFATEAVLTLNSSEQFEISYAGSIADPSLSVITNVDQLGYIEDVHSPDF